MTERGDTNDTIRMICWFAICGLVVFSCSLVGVRMMTTPPEPTHIHYSGFIEDKLAYQTTSGMIIQASHMHYVFKINTTEGHTTWVDVPLDDYATYEVGQRYNFTDNMINQRLNKQ